ncbi:hypothetical protein [Frigoriflavimonas asaccharolytica]|uniref:Outer membrane protein with beta-barrel domain n=1 Tax=Frigoriflavimonas asaccharolytica TaxID=2735899 RepID=A0A8J8GCQ5_9FLAO|nr:hypothetical protein [Frigoriflavimonas asaccharolytica]NRS93322.1 hypothetical protein [Frigoriflavimonas asaccharolytica]
MKTTILFIAMMITSFAFAQKPDVKNDDEILDLLIPTRIELTIFDDKSYFSVGPKYALNEKNYIGLRGHFNWWDADGSKLIVVPELDYIYRISTYDASKSMITSLQTGVGITPNAISPKIGFTFYHFLTAELGNNFQFKEYENFTTKGFRLSFGINIIF